MKNKQDKGQQVALPLFVNTNRHALALTAALSFLGVLSVLSLGCSEEPVFISRSAEIDLGGQVHEALLEEFGEPLPQDHPLTQLVAEIGNELALHSKRPKIPHQFFVLNTPMVNAFAGPGGYVYVTIGLVQESKSAAELISVIAHEVGHVSEAHTIKKLQRDLGAAYLAELILGKGALSDVVTALNSIYLNTGYSQSNEYEADEFAVRATSIIKYNPYGLVSFFEYIQEYSYDLSGPLKYLSSHPPVGERIKHAKSIITSDYPNASPDSSTHDYRLNHPSHGWQEVQGWLE